MPTQSGSNRPLDERLSEVRNGKAQWLYVAFMGVVLIAASIGLIVLGVSGHGKRDACFGFAVLTVPAAGLAVALAWRTRVLAPWGRRKEDPRADASDQRSRA